MQLQWLTSQGITHLYKIHCVEIRYHYTLTCEDVNAVDMSELAPIYCDCDDLVWIKISWGGWKNYLLKKSIIWNRFEPKIEGLI